MLDNLMHFLHGLRVSIKSLFCQKLNLHCINSISLCLRPISIHSVKPCSWRQGLWMTMRVRISSTPRVINFYKISANIEPRISEERKHFIVLGLFFFFFLRGVQNNFSFSKVDVMHFIHHNNPYHYDFI